MPPTSKTRQTKLGQAGTTGKEGVPSHFGKRIKAAMSRAGIDSSKEAAVKLYGLWQARYPDIPISRQRCYDWLDSETANIRADRLYCLSDMFDVSARWLAKGEESIVRLKELGIVERELLETYFALPQISREKLFAEARFLLKTTGDRGQAKPFGRK